MNRIACLLAVLGSLLASRPAVAQREAERLDSLFRKLSREGQFNGTILVAARGKILYHQSFGYADVAQQTPNAPAATFQTASISKVFTATAVLQLLEQGKLQLQDPLVKYFPEFPFPTITLRHLLTHTSGLPDLEVYEAQVRRQPNVVLTNRATIPALRTWSRGLRFVPGTAWRYANNNYILLALLVEKVSGLPYPAYLRRHVFRPAGMTDTYVQIAGRPATDRRQVAEHLLPTLYAVRPERPETVQFQDTLRRWQLRFESYNLAGQVGHGNVISTTRDLLRFDQALAAGRLLTPATQALATTPARLSNGTVASGGAWVDFGGETSYGLGWVLRQDPTVGLIVGHDGYTGAIATMFYRNVTKGQTIVAFDNTVGEQFREKIAAVVSILNHQRPQPVTIKQSAARAYGVALRHESPEKALLRFNAARADTARYHLSERELNVLGYEFLFNGFPAQALEVFKTNALLFPTSFNVYDSYGDAFRQAGRRQEAILMFQQALALNPHSEGSKQALSELLQNAP